MTVITKNDRVFVINASNLPIQFQPNVSVSKFVCLLHRLPNEEVLMEEVKRKQKPNTENQLFVKQL